MSSHTPATGFQTDLGRVVLLAYASGDVVAGEWHLVNTDMIVPDFGVQITPVSNGEGTFSDAGATFLPHDARDFKTKLQNFLLEAFAGGREIEGTWKLRYARDDLPEWNVRIVMGNARASASLDRLQNSNR